MLESACEKLGLTEAKGTATPGHKADATGSGIEVKARRQDPRPVSDPEAAWPGFDESPKLEEDGLKRFQSVAALLNFSAQDRPDL